MGLFSAQQKQALGWFVIILLIGVPSAAILDATGIFPNPIGAWVLSPFNITPGGGGQEVIVEGEKLSQFTMTAVKEDATATKVTSATVYIWCDWNKNGAMDLGAFQGYINGVLSGGEIEETSTDATTGVFTSPSNYIIGSTIYGFIDDGAETYQNAYFKIQMTGEPASDLTPMPLGNVAVRLTDDGAISYSGLIGGVAIDDSTDYNYTLSGTTAEFEFRAKWATSDAGVSPGYMDEFWAGEYWIHWGNGKKYTPNFIGLYGTNQDITDAGLDSGDFDFWYQGATNTFAAIFITSDMANLFYDSDLDTAPTLTAVFDVDISAAGALVYVGIYQPHEWSDFARGSWASTTDAFVMGTLGADWDYVA